MVLSKPIISGLVIPFYSSSVEVRKCKDCIESYLTVKSVENTLEEKDAKMTDSREGISNKLLWWVLGIIGAVFGTILVGAIMENKGPLSTPPRSDVSIFGFPPGILINVESIETLRSMDTMINVVVYNAGKAAAERCYVRWKFPPSWDLRVSDYFGVGPEDKQTVLLDLYSLQQTIISEGVPWPSNQRHDIQTEARLICDDEVSAVYNSSLSVYPQTIP
jgi:hypothetical protein